MMVDSNFVFFTKVTLPSDCFHSLRSIREYQSTDKKNKKEAKK